MEQLPSGVISGSLKSPWLGPLGSRVVMSQLYGATFPKHAQPSEALPVHACSLQDSVESGNRQRSLSWTIWRSPFPRIEHLNPSTSQKGPGHQPLQRRSCADPGRLPGGHSGWSLSWAGESLADPGCPMSIRSFVPTRAVAYTYLGKKHKSISLDMTQILK